jgi:hypothetical protein
MIRIFQTKFGDEGNCFAACVASLLEVDLRSIPQLGSTEGWDDYTDRLNPFLVSEHHCFLQHLLYKDFSQWYDENFKGSYCIVSGQSNENPSLEHAVMWRDGKIVHDPNPKQLGIAGINHGFFFIRLFP